MTLQCRFISYNSCAICGSCWHQRRLCLGGSGGTETVPSSRYCCDPRIVLKNNVYIKKSSYETTEPSPSYVLNSRETKTRITHESVRVYSRQSPLERKWTSNKTGWDKKWSLYTQVEWDSAWEVPLGTVPMGTVGHVNTCSSVVECLSYLLSHKDKHKKVHAVSFPIFDILKRVWWQKTCQWLP